MAERAKMKEFNNFTAHPSFLVCCKNFFFHDGKMSRGHILSHFQTVTDTGNTPKKWFLSRKRPKEGERVGRGHFHERVGESPRRYENFGTSGSPVAFFVSEIRPFENCLGSKSNFK